MVERQIVFSWVVSYLRMSVAVLIKRDHHC